jgi:hypothetical protein
MNFIIKRIGNWISVKKDMAVSKTTIPFGFIAVVKNGKSLSFTRRGFQC